jgi:sigma-B regulation protein RsbQ
MNISRNGISISYSLSGAGEITLLFVHGSFTSKEYWEPQISYFKSQYNVIAIDLPAHGESGNNRTTWSIEEFGKDVSELIYQLDLKNVILIGHSIGADIILEVAIANPQRIIGIVAIEAFRNAGTEMSEEVKKQFDTILDNLQKKFSDTAEAYAQRGLLTNETAPSIKDKITDAYRNAYPPMGVASVDSLFHYALRERNLLQQLKFKLHVINVNYAPTNEALIKQYAASGCRLTILHGTSHFPMLEIPDELNRALEKSFHAINVHAKENELVHHQ